MRAALKILAVAFLSVVLAWTQGGFAANAESAPAKTCACSDCQKACCAKNSSPASQQPVAPAPPASQTPASLFIAALGSITTFAPSTADNLPRILFTSSGGAAATPLYQRNCSYLI